MIEPGPVIPQPPTEPNAPPPGQGRASDPLPFDTLDDNVRGRPITAAADGFGQLWRNRYRIRLAGLDTTAAELVQYWRTEFGHFWPEGNIFYRPVNGLEEGEVALFDLAMPFGTRLTTGIVVADVQPASFTFLTSRGHTFAGRITFSGEAADGDLVAQVESVVRATDPIYEVGLPLGGRARDDRFWEQALRNLAAHLGLRAEPETTRELLDRRRRWRNAGNIRDNAYLHTAAAMLLRPFRFALARLTGKGRAS
jgi:hypothetical protein